MKIMRWMLMLALLLVPATACAEPADICRAIEPAALDERFVDMDPAMIERAAAPIWDAFDFVGRVSEGGNFGYIVGKAREENPLKGLSSAGVGEEVGEVTKEYTIFYPRDDETQILYRFDCDDVYTVSSLDRHDMVFIVPSGYACADLYFLFFDYLDHPDTFEAVTDQGVSLMEPRKHPYASVYMYTEDGPKSKYFLLDEQQVKGFKNDKRLATEKEGGFGITFVSMGKDGKLGYDRSVPVSLLRLAEQKCGYRLPTQREKRDKIVSAHLAAKLREYDFGRLHTYAEQTVTDPDKLATLQKLFQSAKYDDGGKCPYIGILTLTFEDGCTEQMYKAIDSCDGVIVGSHTFISLDNKGNARFWKIFDEVNAAIESRYSDS